jgi:hypothetical protein
MYSTKWTHNSARTRSTGLRRPSTRYCPDTTQIGSTHRAKQWTPFTSPIRLGEKKTTSATRHGPCYPKTTAEWRSSHGGRPPLARKSVALGPFRIGVPRDGPAGPRSLVPSRAAAQTRYSRRASMARHCLPDSLRA